MAQIPLSSNRRQPANRAGCVLLSIALLLIVGVGLYIGGGLLGAPLPGFGPSQTAITTTSLNTSFPFEGVNITLVDAQQSQNFVDDSNTRNDGMLRLKLQAANNTNVRVNWSYEDVAQLVLPGNTATRPTYVNGPVNLAAGKAQTSIIDFAAPTGDALTKLTLRLGAANEAQLDIPLKANADLSAYLARVTSLNGQVVYFGLNWTLKSATSSLSIAGQQAPGGMRFITLTLSVDNTLSQTAITGSPYDYARLKFGNAVASPLDSDLPISFQSGATSVMGTLSFLAPQKGAAFTLLFLPQSQNSNDQATIPFEINS